MDWKHLTPISLKFGMWVMTAEGISTAKKIQFLRSNMKIRTCENCIIALPVSILTVWSALASWAAWHNHHMSWFTYTCTYFVCSCMQGYWTLLSIIEVSLVHTVPSPIWNIHTPGIPTLLVWSMLIMSGVCDPFMTIVVESSI